MKWLVTLIALLVTGCMAHRVESDTRCVREEWSKDADPAEIWVCYP